MTEPNILNREIRPDFTGHEQTVNTRHAMTPAPEHIDGPHREPYPEQEADGEFIYLRLSVGFGEYAIPIVVGEDPPESDKTVDIDRVLFHDERLRLEAPLPDGDILRLIEGGMTQREHPFWEREIVTERIHDPDVILWERDP